MKQFQFEFRDINNFNRELARIKRYCESSESCKVTFQIFTQEMELTTVNEITAILDENFPDAIYYGAQTFGNIMDGEKAEDKTTVICTVYEFASSRYQILHIDTDKKKKAEWNDLKFLSDWVKENPWVKAIEMVSSVEAAHDLIATNHYLKLPNDVQMFGGLACNPSSINIENGVVFSKGYEPSDTALMLIAYGGVDLHFDSTYILGWKPLGKEFTVTKCKDNIIDELDGAPTFDIYKKYLKINQADDFLANAFEFPFLIEENNTYCIRTPIGLMEDGGIMTTIKVANGSHVRMAYGDPSTIIDTICGCLKEISDFAPDIIRVYSCAVRRLFWGANIGQETLPFESIAPTTGFYTHGEIFKSEDYTFTFNCTLVVASIREGEPIRIDYDDSEFGNEGGRKLSLVSRMVNFISAATEELEAANQKLAKLSVTDNLTQLFNRGETQNKIVSNLDTFAHSKFGLIMLDIDNFKSVNDTYGHDAGDEVIKTLAGVLAKYAAKDPDAFAGRWGGEEFMFGRKVKDLGELTKIAENIRQEFAKVRYSFGASCTVSVGVTMPQFGDTWEVMCKRVDDALYESKQTGKNRVTVR